MGQDGASQGGVRIDRRGFVAGALSLPIVGTAPLHAASRLPPEPLRRAIADARDFARSDAAQIWPGFARAPFQLLLVGDESEHLFYSGGPASGFSQTFPDPVTGGPVKSRRRRHARNLLSTFPAVDGIPTVVVGHPDATARPSIADWTIMLLHEHFHQLQYSTAGYQKRIEALNLSSGDVTGRWMLDFPFPYADGAVAAQARLSASVLARAIAHRDRARLVDYLAARDTLRDHAGVRNWRYFAFQCYQEGVARHAEIQLAANSPRDDWQAAATRLRQQTLAVLRDFNLTGDKRVGIYAYGAGEALLLDRWMPGWEQRYLNQPMSLDALFDALRA